MYALFFARFLRIFVLLPCLLAVTLTALFLRILTLQITSAPGPTSREMTGELRLS